MWNSPKKTLAKEELLTRYSFQFFLSFALTGMRFEKDMEYVNVQVTD